MAVTLRQRDEDVFYPDSDGKPMADNTLQFNWIVTIKGGMETLFRNDPNVFVAGDLLWYPVKGDNKTRLAPDTMVAFGRPKGYRGSYRQWEEGDTAPQVVFEVLSPGNTRKEMAAKREFYARFGVEEYYEYDPDHGVLRGWTIAAGALSPIAAMEGWISLRLGVRFGLEGKDLVLTGPDGERFQDYVELAVARNEAKTHARQAEARAKEAETHVREAEARAREAEARAERLAARMKALGIDDV